MRILYHHRTQGKGVEAAHILGIVKAWQKKNIEVDIVSPPGTSLGQARTRPQPASLSGRCFGFLSRRVPEVVFELMELCYNFWASRKLSRLLSKRSYDFIFERYAILNWAGAVQAKRRAIPFFLEVNYTSYTPLYRERSSLLQQVAHRIDRFLFRRATGLVAVSSQLKTHLIELGVSPERIIVLPNAADPSTFDPGLSADGLRSQLGLEGKTILGFVGFFYPWHRVDLLIDNVRSVTAQIENVVFVLIGDGPTRKELEDRVNSERLADHVRFLGVIDHQLLPRYISMFDVAVVPHSNSYGSPMKIFEYMAMGKPVVAPDLGPLRDGICSDREGILFEPQNATALGEALCKLLGDRVLRHRMGAAARRKIESSHNWDNNANSILELYTRTQAS